MDFGYRMISAVHGLPKFGPSIFACLVLLRKRMCADPWRGSALIDLFVIRLARIFLYPRVELNESQRNAVAAGFAEIIPKIGLHVLACSIMPDHVHVVTLQHRETIEQVVGFLKCAATRKLNELELHPLKDFVDARGRVPTPWVQHGWNRFLNDERAVLDAIGYVLGNPLKIGLPLQDWAFVEGWRGTPRGRGG